MNNIKIEMKERHADVFLCNEKIGTISFERNPLHNQNIYLDLQFKYFDLDISKRVFAVFRENVKAPLQIMLPSAEQEMVAFIKVAGFVCKRKCYEVEVGVFDYVGRTVEYPMACAMAGQVIYEQCCDRMLKRYILTHKDINPWTGTQDDFRRQLPRMVYYDANEDEIRNFAFLEDNEIAYVFGTDVEEFGRFAEGLLTELFREFECVTFEADDCDEYAMKLRGLFVNQPDESYDTYVL